ncbi:MAG: hypothetical protein JW863_01980 [Chitinispirillaceae bacterium]|nr:hypothetical protein [Chitinispirillaceae bacterium]
MACSRENKGADRQGLHQGDKRRAVLTRKRRRRENSGHVDRSHRREGSEEWKRGLDSDWITEIIALTEEYDNVYTDFSCWDISEARQTFRELLSSRQHGHLRKKILFGTDWYMTLLALKGKNYKKFCEEFWEFFQGLPGGMELWERFTFVNPINYYGIFDKLPGGQGDKLDAMFSALKKNKCDKTKLDDNFKSLRRVQQYYELIRND